MSSHRPCGQYRRPDQEIGLIPAVWRNATLCCHTLLLNCTVTPYVTPYYHTLPTHLTVIQYCHTILLHLTVAPYCHIILSQDYVYSGSLSTARYAIQQLKIKFHNAVGGMCTIHTYFEIAMPSPPFTVYLTDTSIVTTSAEHSAIGAHSPVPHRAITLYCYIVQTHLTASPYSHTVLAHCTIHTIHVMVGCRTVTRCLMYWELCIPSLTDAYWIL